MSLTNLFRSCLWQRLQAAPFRTLFQHRHKTYRSKVVVSRPMEQVAAKRDILIYVHKKGLRMAMMIGCFVVATWFCLETGKTFKVAGESLKAKHDLLPAEEKEKSKGRFTIDMFKFKEGKYHHRIAVGFQLLALVSAIMAIIVPPRYVKAIVMMKDGANVCFKSYAPFGRSKHILVPWDKVSAMHPFSAKTGRSVFIKSKNHVIPFYMSSTGDVINPELLDEKLRNVSR